MRAHATEGIDIYGRAALTLMALRRIINCSYADPSKITHNFPTASIVTSTVMANKM